MPSIHYASAARSALARLLACIAPAMDWPKVSKPSRRELAAMTRDIVGSEIIAVAGELPSAYGIGWNHRPVPGWRADTGVSGGPPDNPDDFGDPGIGVPLDAPRPSLGWSGARQAALAA
jgi:hypothetical protein